MSNEFVRGRAVGDKNTLSDWVDRELAGCEFEDERLRGRFRVLLEKLWNGMGESIPFACQDWANTKAAYRFFSNDRVNEADILAGHFQSTRSRFAATDGPVLVLQDTTEFNYDREQPTISGPPRRSIVAETKAGESDITRFAVFSCIPALR